jgi:glycosyltransferase involved in cell wall biosynthesis
MKKNDPKMDISKFRLKFFVHEFTRSVGHSNALIETIKRFPEEAIATSTVYAFFYDKKIEEELPGLTIKGLGPYPKFPFILKVLYFQLICLFMKLFKKSTDIWISIGTANLWPDIVNIQFIQKQWEPYFFELSRPKGLIKLYKRILFFVLKKQEDYVFDNTRYYSVLAPFMEDYLVKNFSIARERIAILPSSVDVQRFRPSEYNSEEIIKKFPELKDINFEKPIYLFVGALERKGFKQALKALEKLDNAQFLVVGKGEAFHSWEVKNSSVNIFHIEFTNEIEQVFNISDCFIFPTIYEPFGLVIFEAFGAGLDIYVTRSNVGASDLISEDSNVNLIEDVNHFVVRETIKLTQAQKIERVEERMKIINRFTWEDCSRGFYNQIKKSIESRISD